jgi:hypothetical protein
MRIWIRNPFDPGSGMEKFRAGINIPTKNDHSIYVVFFCSEILDKAALAEDNYEQMAYVAAFTLSAYRYLHCMFVLHRVSMKKPAKLICKKYGKFLNKGNPRVIYPSVH